MPKSQHNSLTSSGMVKLNHCLPPIQSFFSANYSTNFMFSSRTYNKMVLLKDEIHLLYVYSKIFNNFKCLLISANLQRKPDKDVTDCETDKTGIQTLIYSHQHLHDSRWSRQQSPTSPRSEFFNVIIIHFVLV
jgi:hypothetical protein